MIRVGQRSGLSARVDIGEIDVVHDLYARSVRRLGTPVFSRRYFRLLCERFGESCSLLVVRHGATPAAGVLSFLYKGAIMPYYAGSRRELASHAVNDFLYWELMRHAIRRGAHSFDFGRSKEGTGAYAFKQHWGFVAEPLRYRVYGNPSASVARDSLEDAPVRLLRRAWSRLPLPLTKLLGPLIVRRFGPYYT
jgi:FemAB-related protein (PEP-CTERM system-associated)